MVPGDRGRPGDFLPLLRAQLRDPEGDRRWAAAQLLSNVRGDDEAVLALLGEALEDETIRPHAIGSMGSMGRQAARVVPLLVGQRARAPFYVVDALAVLAVEAPLAKDALRRIAANADDPDVRQTAAEALEEIERLAAGR